ncbi:MAG: Na(+)-translocating NADH-quinone reductase subunit A [Bacteroidales bacterium]|nr:Na(+)-translocating NADH-quinone reductase subunit A [Bacteroidales bacterium]
MNNIIKIKKGFDIKLDGIAEKRISSGKAPQTYAIKPYDFLHILPKLVVSEGDTVTTGSTLFYDKNDNRLLFVSPVNGIISEIVRGEKRAIKEIIVKTDKDLHSVAPAFNIDESSKESITETLLKTGLWQYIRQRPYSIIAKPEDKPKAIFIKGFDTAPLAPDYDFILKDKFQYLQKGIDILKKLTEGNVYYSLHQKLNNTLNYNHLKNTEIKLFSGPHPSGNIGVQIHHINPVNKGEKLWFTDATDLIIIGKLFTDKVLDFSKTIALTGPCIKNPAYYNVYSGACIDELIINNTEEGDLRYISGNVLTGTKIEKTGFIGAYANQITVIKEGKYYEFAGWAMPGIDKFSFSKTFLSKLIPRKHYDFDTNLHGGHRAFVITGLYEKVLPMDIYPLYLIKAILAEDIDAMENLGIYEVDEEDFALCEYVCPSKSDLQEIIRKGLDLMIKEEG